MSYLRNGQRIITATEKAVRADRRALAFGTSELNIYRDADRRYSLSQKNVSAGIEWILRFYSLPELRKEIKRIEHDMIQRRFEMFATMQWERTGIWTEGVSASGCHKERRAWLYYHEANLKYYRAIEKRLTN